MLAAALLAVWIDASLVAQAQPRWTNVTAASGLERAGHAIAYDSQRGITVLFGGFNPSAGYLDDTWEWDGT